MPFLIADNLVKTFRIGSQRIEVLRSVSFSAERGEWVALTGASGSGKTTLLDIVGTISKPDSGLLEIDERNVSGLSGSQLVTFRRKKIGFVFQSYHILPELNILENVMLPGLLDGKSKRVCRDKAEKLLTRVGLTHRIGHRPNELSGGEQQRAAIARALMNDPALLLADEPTGNLDSNTGKGILDIFGELHSGGDVTILMVTHDPHVAALADRRIELADGSIRNFNAPPVSFSASKESLQR